MFFANEQHVFLKISFEVGLTLVFFASKFFECVRFFEMVVIPVLGATLPTPERIRNDAN